MLLLLAAVEWTYGWTALGWRFNHGDLTIYTDATARLLSGGSWYLERQLHGPYPLAFGDVLYPPTVAFAPWLVLPGWTFVLIPSLILAWHLRDASPRGWFLVGLCLLWPETGIKVLSANPNIWIAAFVALGIRYRWPAALVLLKPSVFPFALIGARDRRWWLVAAALAVMTLPWLSEALAWPSVVLDARGGGLLYSLADVPLLLLPFAVKVR